MQQKNFMESTEVEEAQIFPKIVFRGLGGRLDELRIAGSKKAMVVNSDLLFQNKNKTGFVLYMWPGAN